MTTQSLAPELSDVQPAIGKTFAIRAVAYVVDSILVSVVHLVVTFVVAFTIGVLLVLGGQEPVVGPEPSWFVNFVYGLFITVLYFVTFEALHGATPGKLMLGMRVVMEDGTPCTTGAALVRMLLRFVDGLPIFGLVAYARMKPPYYQRVGDKSAKTLVVGARDPIIQNPRPWIWFAIAAALFLAFDAISATLMTLARLL